MQVLLTECRDYSPEAANVLRKFGALREYDDTNQSLLEAVKECEVLVVRLRYAIDAELIEAAPRLRYIVSATTGLDHIDLNAAAMRGIQVVSLKGETEFLNTVSSTAELAWGLLLSVVRRIPAAHAAVTAGHWNRDSFWGRDLFGLRLGILGMGRLGTKVAGYGRAFGMTVSYCDPHVEASLVGLARYSTAAELAAANDVLSIHVPFDDSTVRIVDREVLTRMSPTGILINTSRGAVLDEDALLDLLEQNKFGGAGLDVIRDEAGEIVVRNSRLLRYLNENDNLVVTPHIGGATRSSMHKAEEFVANKLIRMILNQ